MKLKDRIDFICETLKQDFPEVKCALHHSNEHELLFATRLSAQCTDERVNIVTKDLFEQFPTLLDYAVADVKDIENCIKSCGLYKVKAKDLKNCAIMLLEKFDGKVPDNMEDLLLLPGIGRKTANLILGDIYGKPAIIADTHCIRLSNRLGFVKDTKDPLKVEMRLKEIIKKEEQTKLCHRLVWHGRLTCTARKPMCEKCSISAVCPSFMKQ